MNDVVKFVFDALENPEEAIERSGIGPIHMALKPHLLNWMQDRGKLKRSVEMVSVVGSTNYGTVVETSDIDMKAVYMPAFEDFYYGKFPKFSFTTPEFDCELHPAHTFCQHVLKGNINFFEFLYAEDCLARPNFIGIMKLILQPMVAMNVTMTCMASFFTAVQQDKGTSYGILGLAEWPHKKASHAIRILAFLINLLDTGEFDIKTKEPFLSAVLRLKRNEMDWVEYASLFDETLDVAKQMMFKRWVNGGDYDLTDRVLELDKTTTKEYVDLRRELDFRLMEAIKQPILENSQ